MSDHKKATAAPAATSANAILTPKRVASEDDPDEEEEELEAVAAGAAVAIALTPPVTGPLSVS